jgi:rod shape-determining protein MreD
MARTALTTGRLNRGPRPGVLFIPAATVIAASSLALLPIVSASGWWPDFGFLMLIAWRLMRADAWPAWWAAPLGFVNDLLTSSPIGLSVSLWTVVMLAMDLIDRRTQWRDYWIEWGLAAVLILASEAAQWKIAGLAGAPVPFAHVIPAILIAILAFPIAAVLATKIDRWRLGQ